MKSVIKRVQVSTIPWEQMGKGRKLYHQSCTWRKMSFVYLVSVLYLIIIIVKRNPWAKVMYWSGQSHKISRLFYSFAAPNQTVIISYS